MYTFCLAFLTIEEIRKNGFHRGQQIDRYRVSPSFRRPRYTLTPAAFGSEVLRRCVACLNPWLFPPRRSSIVEAKAIERPGSVVCRSPFDAPAAKRDQSA